jgi:hypothetical protein
MCVCVLISCCCGLGASTWVLRCCCRHTGALLLLVLSCYIVDVCACGSVLGAMTALLTQDKYLGPVVLLQAYRYAAAAVVCHVCFCVLWKLHV